MAAGVSIRTGRLVVDEQGTAHVATIFDAISHGKIRLAMTLEAVLPLLFKQRLVNFLIALHACGRGDVLAIGDALVVHHPR